MRGKDEANKMAHILEHYIFEEVIENIQKISSFKEKRISLINEMFWTQVVIWI